MLQVVNDRMAIGSDRGEDTLQQLVRMGYRTILDLGTPPEGSSWVAASVGAAGLTYHNLPVSAQNLNAETFTAFRQAYSQNPQPTYVYCPSGLRAAVFGLLLLAHAENWTEAEYLAKFQKLGLVQKPDCPLGAFAHAWFTEKS
ncbi:MAG: beta-lactamase hydrolase domain-containing protein [Pseudanabaenaceae cyanobacterium]